MAWELVKIKKTTKEQKNSKRGGGNGKKIDDTN